MLKLCISLFLLASLLPSVSFGKTINLFTLHRVNYKPHKQLRYDLSYDAKKCKINKQKPLRVFYENLATGKPISKFSSNSRKYFSPKWTPSQLKDRQFSFSFKALDEIKMLLGPSSKLTVYLDQVNGQCQVTTEVTYPDDAFDLRHISVSVTFTTIFPTGVEWIELEGVKNGSHYFRKIRN